MADLTITEANIKLADSSCQIFPIVLGETITKGQPLYQLTTDRKWYRTDSDNQATSKARCISVIGGSADEVGIGINHGPLEVGAILTRGTTYVCSVNIGKIAPRADLASGDFVTHLGIAISTSVINVDIDASSITVP